MLFRVRKYSSLFLIRNYGLVLKLINTSILSETNKINGLTRWITNLEHEKLYEPCNFIKTYKGNEKDYPKYDNYDAIEVSEVKNIASDYKGTMGVPITFLSSYNENEFEMLGSSEQFAKPIFIEG